MVIIAMDSHKRYSQVCVEELETGRMVCEARIEHRPGAIRQFLRRWEPGSPVAVETIGNWYWIVEEIEAAGQEPRLVNARRAKLMLGCINKTDKLDARGLNRLQQTGTLPTVWIPPGVLRDHRELPRTRMVFAQQRTRLKNRIHSVLDKYGLGWKFEEISDLFGRQGRRVLEEVKKELPSQTRYTLGILLRQLDGVEAEIRRLEKRMRKVFSRTETVRRLMSLPGIGFILAVVLAQEIGSIERFSTAEKLAGYAGVVPRVHSSGGKTRYGRLRTDVNHYLKWAYAEAGNSVAVNRVVKAERHVSRLYNRIRARRGHSKAVGAVARHLAEASYWVWKKQCMYQEPPSRTVLSRTAEARGLS